MAFYNDVNPDVAAFRLADAAPPSYATFTSTIQDPCWSDPADRSEDHEDSPLTYLTLSVPMIKAFSKTCSIV